jgi:fatty acid desaturase
MAAAARVDPKSFFTDAEWARLTDQSSWMGLALVAHCWAVIFATAAIAMIWPITIPLAVMIIGGRQLGLAILMHDAAHRALHPNPKINDFVGHWLCTPVLDRYRPYHLTHHKYAQQAEDPDLVLSSPFPITRASMRRKIIRDLTGQTYLKQRFGMIAVAVKADARAGHPKNKLSANTKAQLRVIVSGVVCTAVGAYFGYWWAWAALWLLPSATWLPLVSRLRNIAEHACVDEGEPDPMRQARTTHANFIERALIAPYWVNYHCEHHMFMYLPCYRLPQAHRLLKAKGLLPQMEWRPGGYVEVLSMASSKPEPQRLAA